MLVIIILIVLSVAGIAMIKGAIDILKWIMREDDE